MSAGKLGKLLLKTFRFEAAVEAEKYGLPYFKVGVVVMRTKAETKQFLCVHEAKVKRNGKWEDGDGGWNLPAGRLKINEDTLQLETLKQAAERETLEESGHKVKLTGLCHIGQRLDADNPYILLCFMAELDGDEVLNFETDEISETAWKTEFELRRMSEKGRLRNPDFILSAVRNARLGRIAPMEIIKAYKPRNAAM